MKFYRRIFYSRKPVRSTGHILCALVQ